MKRTTVPMSYWCITLELGIPGYIKSHDLYQPKMNVYIILYYIYNIYIYNIYIYNIYIYLYLYIYILFVLYLYI